MSYDYSENVLIQESAAKLLQNELGWEVSFAYNTEVLGENGTFGRRSYRKSGCAGKLQTACAPTSAKTRESAHPIRTGAFPCFLFSRHSAPCTGKP